MTINPFNTVKKLTTALQQRQISSKELTQYYLTRIKQFSALNAFITVDEEYALQQANEADRLIRLNQAKALTGIPIAHKDIFCTTHFPTTCGSKMLANYYSPFAATMVNQLQQAGVVVLGKTNMDEFGMGSTNENSYFGAVSNPWNYNHVAGGSSGGSAAAVAADLVAFATGSDTGGSIRQPAAFCGLSGLKPTYGLISRYGMVAYASSLDQAGILAHSAEDLAAILPHMAGFDPKDSTSVNQKIPDYLTLLPKQLDNLRIGLPSCFFENTDPTIQEKIHEAANCLTKLGAKLFKIDLKLYPYWVPCYYVIACAEASSNLARYDGIRFGYRSSHTDCIKSLITHSRTEGFGEEVKRRILTGTYVLSAGYFDAYYQQALKVRRLIQQEFVEQFKSVDLILGPTTPTVATLLGEQSADPVQNYLADVFTVAVNLAGLPALSIPVGMINHLPIGMQLIGNHFSEDLLLNVSYHYQQMTDWHLSKPTSPSRNG